MNLSYYQFLILQYLAANQHKTLTHRQISDDLMISNTLIMREMENLCKAGFVNNAVHLTDDGLAALAPYKVKRAVILAAGFGSRMMPATADRPKPMVKVNGKYIVSTLIDALLSAGITDITIVRGYKKEKFDELLSLYPDIHFIDNDEYDKYNNISSAVLAKDIFKDGCYLCEADLYISNPSIITPYQYRSNILGSWSIETDDWNFKMDDEGMISHYQKGNTYCWNYYGISYWTPEDCEKLNHDWAEIFATEEGKDVFWEQVPLQLKQDEYRVAVRPCHKQDIMEIDNYYELQQLDPSYESSDASDEAFTAPAGLKQS